MSESLANVLKTVDNIKSAWELGNYEMVAADSAKLTAQLAAGIAVESVLRTYSALDGLGRMLSLWRLDLAISEKSIAGHQALSGVIAGEAVGRLIDGIRDLNLGLHIYDLLHPDENPALSKSVNQNWQTAKTPPRRDPLAIDLDGDGIETVGIPATGSPILFDHDADGTRTGTGWLKGDDAWLVLDRNGNGRIDSGRELFGVDTLITVTEAIPGTSQTQTITRNARTGFEALATLDANGDRAFNASDAAFTQVRLWRDVNQDGISQSNELFTLGSLGITSISLNPTTPTNTNLGNGNAVTGQASVTRANGGTTVIDSVDLQAGNLELADNPFYRQFADTVPLTAAAKALPTMGGSGWVRDLREAMSLGSTAAQTLTQAVATFAAGSTRDQQRAVLDAVIDELVYANVLVIHSLQKFLKPCVKLSH